VAKPSAQTAFRKAKLAKPTANVARTNCNATMRDARVALLAVGLISWQAKGAFRNANVARDDANVARDDTNVARHTTSTWFGDVSATDVT
jgi:hypothetical protein